MTLPVAVVIPAHNAAPYLDIALQSLAEQTAKPVEVVVVDDGSDDNTVAVAEQYGVRCLRQEQRGPGAARNRGLHATTAPLVAFLDADDWFAPNKLERQAQVLTEQGASVIACDAWLVEADKVTRTKNQGRFVPGALTLERLLAGNPLICSTVLARREAVINVGGFDEDKELIATEDYDLWLRLSQREPIAYLDEPLGFYRVHAGSLSTNERFSRGIERIMDKLAATYAREPHFLRLVGTRRRTTRLDLAWDLLLAGRRREARAMIREARLVGGPSWSCLRMWLRSFLPMA
jgi:glycosyltransferase involved in cell wall biosynthesis